MPAWSPGRAGFLSTLEGAIKVTGKEKLTPILMDLQSPMSMAGGIIAFMSMHMDDKIFSLKDRRAAMQSLKAICEMYEEDYDKEEATHA